MNEIIQKKLKNDVIEALMSEWFEAHKSKKWFEEQLVIKKIITKIIESETAIEKIMKTQKVVTDMIENEKSSEIIIIDNISN